MHYLEANDRWPDWTKSTRFTVADEQAASPLVAGLERVLKLAQDALAGPASDTDILNAIGAIQAATLQAEHEHYGDEDIYEDADVPF